MQQIRILLAEDDQNHQRLLLMAIAKGRPSVAVTITSNRDELIAAARDQTFDCIVLDFNVPPYTAPELVAELAPLQPDVPCIVVSSSEDQRVVIESIRNGMDDFLAKRDAMNGHSLWARIEAAVDRAAELRNERRKTNRRLKRLEVRASTDALTGLLNRRALASALRSEARRGDRRDSTAVIVLDLDYFKRVNDTLGHDAGDHVLRDTARVLRERSDKADLVARWGGEEFVVIRQSASVAEAWVWADETRRQIAHKVLLPGEMPTQTVSIGVDVVPTSELNPEVISRADRALYLAKDTTRDRVCTWQMVEAMDAAQSLGIRSDLSADERLRALVASLKHGLGPTQRDHVGPHGRRVREVAALVGRSLDIGPESIAHLEFAAEFHDIGKIGLPEELLACPRVLSFGERKFIDEHARFGADLLRTCGAHELAAEMVERHHGRFDSSNGSSQSAQPSLVSILTACDAVVAMLTDRPFSAAVSVAEALAELGQGRGGQFDPAVVDTLQFIDRKKLRVA